jgi:hypothetical protein
VISQAYPTVNTQAGVKDIFYAEKPNSASFFENKVTDLGNKNKSKNKQEYDLDENIVFKKNYFKQQIQLNLHEDNSLKHYQGFSSLVTEEEPESFQQRIESNSTNFFQKLDKKSNRSSGNRKNPYENW